MKSRRAQRKKGKIGRRKVKDTMNRARRTLRGTAVQTGKKTKVIDKWRENPGERRRKRCPREEAAGRREKNMVSLKGGKRGKSKKTSGKMFGSSGGRGLKQKT